jgi:hypothetical protein
VKLAYAKAHELLSDCGSCAPAPYDGNTEIAKDILNLSAKGSYVPIKLAREFGCRMESVVD